MSDLFVTTSFGDFGLAAAEGSRRSIKTPRRGERIENFFASYDELTDEFPTEGLRRVFVDIGPGSFTGVRIGVTFARVLSQQLKIPIIPVKSLDILSIMNAHDPPMIMLSPIVDAGNGSVYATLFEDGRKKEDDYIVELAEWLDFLENVKDKIHFCGALSENDKAQIKERNFNFEEVGVRNIVEKMIAFSRKGFVKTYQFNDIVPCYLGARKWSGKLEREFIRIKDMKEEARKILIEIDRLNTLVEKKERRIKDINIGVEGLLKKKETVQKDIGRSVEELMGKKKTVKNEIDRLTEGISVLTAKRTAYSESVQQKRNIMSNLNEIISNLKQRVGFFETKIKEKRENLERLKEVPPEISEEIALYIQQRDSLRSEVEELKSEVSKYSKELDDIASARFEKVFSRIQKEEVMLDQLSGMREEKEDELSRVEIKVRELDQQKISMEEEINRLEQRVESLQAEIESAPVESVPEEAPPEIRSLKIENFKYEIRPLKEDNIPEVMAIEEALFQRPWGRQMFKEELSIPVSKLYCIFGKWKESEPLRLFGYAVLWAVAGKAHIINFAVDPAESHRGVGKVLLYEILKKSKEFGCKTAYLEVRISAGFMQKLVEGAGFKKTSLRKDYFGYPREDAIIYEMRM